MALGAKVTRDGNDHRILLILQIAHRDSFLTNEKRAVYLLFPRYRTWVFLVPKIGLKEERRVLWYASDGLKAKVGCQGKPGYAATMRRW